MPIGNTLKQIPRGVWILGCVSLLMDISSEMIHSVLPMFLVGTLGASAFTLGLIEGCAEATALIVKIFSGSLSDFLGKRKPLVTLGYTLATLTKPLFAVAPNIEFVITARLIDRMGKGIREAPRDALITDLTPSHLRGAAFGLRQSLDTVGAVLGPLFAVLLMLLFANNFRLVFWLAMIPGIAAVALIAVRLREPMQQTIERRANPINKTSLHRLDTAYWRVVTIGAVFTLARFSEAFLVLRAQQSGIAIALVPLVMVVMNIIYSVTAYPLGKLSDRIHHRSLLAFGLIVLITADLTLAVSQHWGFIVVGIALWGIHMGMTQGLLAAMVSRTAPAELRGTAFGVFNLICGIALLIASAGAGFVWDRFGAASTFYVGAGCCVIALFCIRFGGLTGR